MVLSPRQQTAKRVKSLALATTPRPSWWFFKTAPRNKYSDTKSHRRESAMFCWSVRCSIPSQTCREDTHTAHSHIAHDRHRVCKNAARRTILSRFPTGIYIFFAFLVAFVFSLLLAFCSGHYANLFRKGVHLTYTWKTMLPPIYNIALDIHQDKPQSNEKRTINRCFCKKTFAAWNTPPSCRYLNTETNVERHFSSTLCKSVEEYTHTPKNGFSKDMYTSKDGFHLFDCYPTKNDDRPSYVRQGNVKGPWNGDASPKMFLAAAHENVMAKRQGLL